MGRYLRPYARTLGWLFGILLCVSVQAGCRSMRPPKNVPLETKGVLATRVDGFEVVKKAFWVASRYREGLDVPGEEIPEAMKENFLRVGDHDVQLPRYLSKGSNVSNAERTVWALNFHAVSDYNDFVLVVRGQDGSFFMVPGVRDGVEKRLTAKGMVADLPYHHQYWHADSIDRNVVTCHLTEYGAKGEYDGRFKIAISETANGIALEPYPLDAEVPDAPPALRGAAGPEHAPLQSRPAASAVPGGIEIVRRPFSLNDLYTRQVAVRGTSVTEALEQNFLRLPEGDLLLPMHDTLGENVSNPEKTVWALNYHNDVDLAIRSKTGAYLIVSTVRGEVGLEMRRKGLIPDRSSDDWWLRAVSVHGNVVTCDLHTQGAKDEYDKRIELSIREARYGVVVEPYPVDSEGPAAARTTSETLAIAERAVRWSDEFMQIPGDQRRVLANMLVYAIDKDAVGLIRYSQTCGVDKNPRLSLCRSWCLYTIAPAKYESSFVDEFPVDRHARGAGLNTVFEEFDMSWEMEPNLIPDPCTCLGQIAERGNEKAIEKLLQLPASTGGEATWRIVHARYRTLQRWPKETIHIAGALFDTGTSVSLLGRTNSLSQEELDRTKAVLRPMLPHASPTERGIIQDALDISLVAPGSLDPELSGGQTYAFHSSK